MTELLLEQARAAGRTAVAREDVGAVRRQCIFTTHTPVAAGHDRFPLELAVRIIGESPIATLPDLFCHEGLLNLTYVGLNFSHYVNGVAMRHGEVSRAMFGGYAIDAITNGVHAATWTAGEFQELFDRHIPGWQRDNFSLRYALGIPREEIARAHAGAKARLIERVAFDTGVRFDPDAFTIGFARRATEYKRADLLLHDVDVLQRIAAARGALQIVYAGKAHPRDSIGKEMIERIVRAAREAGPLVRIVYLPNHDMALGRLLTSGVDLWLNTPHAPLEASGTSGMKAALNGVPSLSVLDGWWLEGCIEGVTGWAIGDDDGAAAELAPHASDADHASADARSMYGKLEHAILPLFHDDPPGYST